jgi:hypothetical protein
MLSGNYRHLPSRLASILLPEPLGGGPGQWLADTPPEREEPPGIEGQKYWKIPLLNDARLG